jgi:hypothetical protein
MAIVYAENAILNLPGYETTAAIAASIEEIESKMYAYLSLSDCTKTVSYHFELNIDEGNLQNAIHKVETMTAILMNFEEALQKVCKTQKSKIKN